jgi:hypothetical protein
MKHKSFHILPTLMFITAPTKARFKSHIGEKRNVCVPHCFSNDHFNIIILLQCISINVTNSQSYAESGYTSVFIDGSDCQTEVNCYCVLQVSVRPFATCFPSDKVFDLSLVPIKYRRPHGIK